MTFNTLHHKDMTVVFPYNTYESSKQLTDLMKERARLKPFISLTVFVCVCNTNHLLWMESGSPQDPGPINASQAERLENVMFKCPVCSTNYGFSFQQSKIGSKIRLLESWPSSLRLKEESGLVQENLDLKDYINRHQKAVNTLRKQAEEQEKIISRQDNEIYRLEEQIIRLENTSTKHLQDELDLKTKQLERAAKDIARLEEALARGSITDWMYDNKGKSKKGPIHMTQINLTTPSLTKPKKGP